MNEPIYFKLLEGAKRSMRLPSGRMVTFYQAHPDLTPITDDVDVAALRAHHAFEEVGAAKAPKAEAKAVTTASVRQEAQTAALGETDAGAGSVAPVTTADKAPKAKKTTRSKKG